MSATVILANGRFPTNPCVVGELYKAERIVCCDGAAENLIAFGMEPSAIVGDLDSLASHFKRSFASRLYHFPDQNSNDLTKAVRWCNAHGFKKLVILAGTGLRDDHTLGNIGLLPLYAQLGVEVRMVSDYGTFTPLLHSAKLASFKGQQVSLFSFNNQTLLSTQNLMYPIDNKSLAEPWMGTLNQSLGDWFEVNFSPGPLIVYQTHVAK